MRSLIAVFVFCSTSCGLVCPTYKCLSQGAIVIRVSDAETHGPLLGASVLTSLDGGTPAEVGPCRFDLEASEDGGTNCHAIPSRGKYHLTVRADGYAQTELDVEAATDVCGRVPAQLRQVDLQKLGSSTQALVTSSEGGCGG